VRATPFEGDAGAWDELVAASAAPFIVAASPANDGIQRRRADLQDAPVWHLFSSQLNCASNCETDMDYREIITIDPGKRGGRPYIRGLRVAVADVLGWLASGMSHAEILADYPELTNEDIRACLAYAAERERRLLTAK